MSGCSLAHRTQIVWKIARKTKHNPAAVSQDDVSTLLTIERVTSCRNLRRLAAQTIADVIIHAPQPAADFALNSDEVGHEAARR